MSDSFTLLSRPELQRRRAKILARIRRRFDIVEESLAIGPLRLLFTRVVDADRVLDQVIAADQGEDHLPYWAELWSSSLGVGRFLVESKRPTQRVLDLGCGMGLAGTVAAAMGHEVLLADLEADALLFAKLNTLPFQQRARTRRLNWQTDNLGERFDLIIGADVLYDRSQWDYLDRFWQAHLAEGGTILLGEPGRQTGDLFLEWIAAKKWTLQRFEQSLAPNSRPIRLFQLSR